MFVLHSDCNNVWNICRYCSSCATSDDQTSDFKQLQRASEPSSESFGNSSEYRGDDKTPNQQKILLSTTTSSSNESTNTVNVDASPDLLAEQMKQQIIEIHGKLLVGVGPYYVCRVPNP